MGPGRWDAHDHLLGRLESAKQATRELLPSCRCSPPCEVLLVHQMELRQRSLLEPAAARCTLPLLQQQSELQSHGQHAEAHATQCVRGAQRMSSAALFFLADAIHAAPINWSQQSVQHTGTTASGTPRGLQNQSRSRCNLESDFDLDMRRRGLPTGVWRTSRETPLPCTRRSRLLSVSSHQA